MFIALIFMVLTIRLSEGISVHVKQGPVRGHVLYAGQYEVYSFKNVPYAKPPVGDLRFQLPEEHEGWLTEDDLHGNVKIHCSQNSFYEDEILPDAIMGQEDCLVLDVYVRKNHDTENITLPVLVYFHGGNFNRGSKEDYGPDYLMRHNDVILVVPNYRLGVLGFLSFQDTLLSGNLGLWDQNAALKWVSENIHHFGGDPKQVTIAGHEAGAASVGLHILAPPSHNYFQGALSDSGTAMSPWLIDTDPLPTIAHRVAEALQCPTASVNEILQCLRTVTLQEILKVQGQIKKAVFLPTIDSSAENPLIPFPPRILYQKGYQKNVNYLIGFTESEASYEVSREFPNVLKYQHLDKMIQHFLKPHFKNVLNFEMIAKAAKYHYLRGVMIPTFESIEPQITRMMTDFLYKSPLEQVIKLHRDQADSIFVYVSKPKTSSSCGLENRRCYGNEFYIYNTTDFHNMFDLTHQNIERKTETLSKTWGNFIKYGYPDVYGRWKPFKDIHELHYSEISDSIQPRTNYGGDDSEFWISLVSELKMAQNATEEMTNAHSTSEYSTIGTWGVTGLAILCGVLCIAMIGVVIITKRRTLTLSVSPVSSPKDIKIHQ